MDARLTNVEGSAEDPSYQLVDAAQAPMTTSKTVSIADIIAYVMGCGKPLSTSNLAPSQSGILLPSSLIRLTSFIRSAAPPLAASAFSTSTPVNTNFGQYVPLFSQNISSLYRHPQMTTHLPTGPPTYEQCDRLHPIALLNLNLPEAEAFAFSTPPIPFRTLEILYLS